MTDTMDELRARAILANFIQPDDILVGSHNRDDDRVAEFSNDGGARLRGVFDAEELEAIAWWLRNKPHR